MKCARTSGTGGVTVLLEIVLVNLCYVIHASVTSCTDLYQMLISV